MRLWPRLLSPHLGMHAGHALAADPEPQQPAGPLVDDLEIARARRAVRDYLPLDPRDPLPPYSYAQLVLLSNELHQAARVFQVLAGDR